GLDAYLGGEDIVAVEWPDRAGDALPWSGLLITLTLAEVDDLDRSDEAQVVKTGPDAEPPRLIRFRALDPVAAVALQAMAVPAEPGLNEAPCPPVAVDHG
ncbi:MAG: hypothetical protein IPJ58_00005, partial [Ardenticatenia bacterium]|nr:hypothetical protein [Ardenticatenia bacterium]